MSFEGIIGNEKIKKVLQKAIETKSVLHSYLFIGPEGIGKRLFAEEFAKMILCQEEEKPCNRCKSCIEFASYNHPDFQIIEPDGNRIKIEQIRQMQKKILERPIVSDQKIIIINDSNLMTKEAQNCLLKTLEEPPFYITIILIGESENQFLNTIQSRCTKIVFKKIEDESLKSYIYTNLKLKDMSEDMLELFDGSVKRAIMLKDKIDIYKNTSNLVDIFKKSDIIDVLNKAEYLYKEKEDIGEILDYLNIRLYKKASQEKENKLPYLNSMQFVEDTKRHLLYNANFDMSIDYLLLQIWEELNNEKHYRSQV